MREQLAGAGMTAAGLMVPVILIVLVLLFLKGGVWAGQNMLPYLTPVASVVLLLDLAVLLPLSIFRRLRRFTGNGLFLSSYLFGLITWLQGLLLTYYLWGLVAVIVGFVLGGVGVVPVGMLATLFNGHWAELLTLVLGVLFTFGARAVGIAIATSGAPETDAAEELIDDADAEAAVDGR